MSVKKKLIFIVGPTAIGKTPLAIKLAKDIKGEIISSDSMQVYKGMDILSQAPSRTQTKRIRYHLIRFLDPKDEFSVAAFIDKATHLIGKIIGQKKIPIVAGGSGLYVKCLIDGLFLSPKADLKFRKKMYDFASRYGSARLHKNLLKADPGSALSIHPNDTRRIVRALELLHATGRTMTELKNNTKGLNDIYNIRIFGLIAPREAIYANIDDRVDEMIERGALDEVRRLSRRKISRTARSVLGFKELSGYLGGEYDLETAIGLIKRNTRRFAKRQLTWFRADKRIKWFDVSKMTSGKIVKAMAKGVK